MGKTIMLEAVGSGCRPPDVPDCGDESSPFDHE